MGGNGQAPAAAAPSGDPAQMFEGPQAQQIADEAGERAKKATPEAKKEIGKFQFDWEQAWEQAQEQFGSKLKLPDMKSKEEKALWLMDFGFRLMAAAGSNDFFTSVGMAGSGANQNQQQRELALTQMATQDQRAGQRLGMAAVGQQAGAFQQNLQSMQGELLTTDQGVFRMMPDGTTVPVTGPDGTQLTGDNRRGFGGRGEFEFERRLELMRSAGYSEREAIDILMGARTPDEKRFEAKKIAADIWQTYSKDTNRRAVPPGGTERKRFDEWTPEEIQAFIQQQEQWLLGSFLSSGSEQGALTGGEGAPVAPIGSLPPSSAVVPGQSGVIRGRSGPVPVAPGTGGEPVRITSQQEYDQLPSGAQFIAPDGSTRIKP
jgi:hypothetical protein